MGVGSSDGCSIVGVRRAGGVVAGTGGFTLTVGGGGGGGAAGMGATGGGSVSLTSIGLWIVVVFCRLIQTKVKPSAASNATTKTVTGNKELRVPRPASAPLSPIGLAADVS
jgi:hypothetical protein